MQWLPEPRPHQTILGRRWQAVGTLLMMVSCLLLPRHSAHATTDASTELRLRCDALISSAVRRPYGLAWSASEATSEPRGAGQHVSLTPGHTPAAALLLTLASETLDDPQYLDAAVDAARGLLATQERSGRLPAEPVFATRAGGRDEPAAVPDRSATRAAVGFLIVLHLHLETPDPRIRGVATRAAHWLARQQGATGAWPTPHSPDAEPRHTIRIIRLDDPDYRDGTLALLLAGHVLEDRNLIRSGERAVEMLLKTRLPQRRRPTDGLWPTTCTMDGLPNAERLGLTDGADITATYYAMQTLLGAYLITGTQDWGLTLQETAQRLRQLRTRDGLWDRHPDARRRDPLRQAPEGAFDNPDDPDPSRRPTVDSSKIEQLLEIVEQLRQLGRDDFLTQTSTHFTLPQHLALGLCGIDELWTLLTTTPTAAPLPADDSAPLLPALPNTPLAMRVHRLWLTLLNAKLETIEPVREEAPMTKPQ